MKPHGSTPTILITGAAILVVALVALAFGGAFGTGNTVSSSSEAAPAERIEPPRDGSTGIVTGSHRKHVGLNLLGWQVTPDSYAVHVAMVPPEGCEAMDGGEVPREGACADAPAHGPVTGGGETGSYTFVIVQVEVAEECAETVREGDAWPPENEACIP